MTVVSAALVVTGAVSTVAFSGGPPDGSNVVGPLPEQRAAFVVTPSVGATTTTTSTTEAPTTTTSTTMRRAATSSSKTTSTTGIDTLLPGTDGNSGRFALAPGAALPSDSYCASQVTAAKETRSGNTTANHTKPSGKLNFAGNLGSNPGANADLKRVDGNYTGTTDEIIQWASCKWGFDVDVTRAQAFLESSWHQTSVSGFVQDQSECVGGMQVPCPLAFGIMQLQSNSQPHTYPWSASSTAFNLDYALAMKRACYDGVSWFGSQTRGDAWGCVATFNTGVYPIGPIGNLYISQVKNVLSTKPWQ